MAYSKKDLEKQALHIIKKEDLVFLNEVISYLPCSKATFYNKKLDELDSIREALEKNKTNQKKEVRNKWRKSDNPTAQIAYYRLLSDDEENDKLNGGKQRSAIEHSGDVSVKLSAEKSFREAAAKYRESITNNK